MKPPLPGAKAGTYQKPGQVAGVRPALERQPTAEERRRAEEQAKRVQLQQTIVEVVGILARTSGPEVQVERGHKRRFRSQQFTHRCENLTFDVRMSIGHHRSVEGQKHRVDRQFPSLRGHQLFAQPEESLLGRAPARPALYR